MVSSSSLFLVIAVSPVLLIVLVYWNLFYASNQRSEFFAFHHNVVILLSFVFGSDEIAGDDMCIFGDGSSSIYVISSHHAYNDTGFLAIEHSLGYRFFEWVFDTSYTQNN